MRRTPAACPAGGAPGGLRADRPLGKTGAVSTSPLAELGTPELDTAASRALFDRASAVIPGGVNSPVRAFTSVGGTPRFMVSAAGAVADRRRRQPLRRPDLLVGPDDPRPRAPGRRRGGAGGRRRAGCRSARRPRPRSSSPRRSSGGSRRCEQVRLVNSGTEATMSAIRLARGFTGRAGDRQVRRLLPRPRRRAARPGRLRGRHARPAHQPRRHRRAGRRHRSCCPTTTSTPCARRSPSAAARSPA